MKLGRIRIRKTNGEGNIVWGCGERNWGNTEKEAIVGRIAQKHRWGVDGRVKCPFCPTAYRDMGNMKTHIRKGRCPNLKEEQQEIWTNIIAQNEKTEENKVKAR